MTGNVSSYTQHVAGDTSQAVLVALRRIMRTIDLHSRQLVQQLGVTSPQLIVLQHLARRGARLPIGTLAREVSLSPPTVTGIVSRLERRGLVERRDDAADRRRVLVWATPAGEALLATAPPAIQESFIRAFGRLAEWEKLLILGSLERLVTMMEATELDAAPILDAGPIDRDHA